MQTDFGLAMMTEAAAFAVLTPFLTVDTVARAKREGSLAALLARPRRSAAIIAEMVARPISAIVVLVMLSLGLHWGLGLVGESSASELLPAHLQLLLIALVFMLFGLFCSIVFRDSVTAAGVCMVVSMVSVTAPILAGPVVARMANAERVIESALLVSPVVSMATVTGVDVMRLELIYRINPLGRRGFTYPAPEANALYSLVLAATFLAACIGWIRMRGRSLEL